MIKTQEQSSTSILNNYAEVGKSFEHRQYIFSELQKSKDLLDDPNVKIYDAKEVFAEVDQILEAHGL